MIDRPVIERPGIDRPTAMIFSKGNAVVAESKRNATDDAKHVTDSDTNTAFLQLAMLPSVRNRAVGVGLVVGTILALINHLDAVIDGSFAFSNALQIMTTYLVPYAVSTYSSVARSGRPKDPNTDPSRPTLLLRPCYYEKPIESKLSTGR